MANTAYTPPDLTGLPLFCVGNASRVKVFCLAFKAVCVAVEIGLLRSAVLSTLLRPTIVLVNPDTVFANVVAALMVKVSVV